MRMGPECPNYTLCGGCDYLGYPMSASSDQGAILAESIERIGAFPRDAIPEIETINGPRFHYRRHAS